MSSADTTTDHDKIRKWAQERDGHPARVATGGPGGILRIDFGEPEETLEQISWDDFFKIFDENDLAFLYQADDRNSRFNRFIDRDQN